MTMPNVEFVYDKGCPNVEQTRENLLRAFARLGLPPKWTEWERNDANSPDYAKSYGSPTVLVDGKDCLGVSPEHNVSSCRIYDGPDGTLVGIPSIEAIASVLGESPQDTGATAASSNQRSGWLSSAAVLPGIGVALLPKLACPACWPAYAGVLSSVGLGFLVESRYLLFLTTAFLFFALSALVFRARTRRGYGPFGIGVLAATTILVGKFVFESDPTMYAGVGLLVCASFWNSWPRGAAMKAPCPSCVTTGPVAK